jgi:hypothetical protein
VTLARTLLRGARRPWGDPLREGVWRQRPLPEACFGVPTMLMRDELRLLEFLTEEIYRGDGLIVDAGCFLGGSTLALAGGLRKSLTLRRQPEAKLIHSFDLFEVEDWTRGVYFPRETQAGSGTREMFEHNIAAYAPLVEIHEGDITAAPWSSGPIELLFVDVAKHWTVCDWVTANLFPHLIPGRSIVVQQDYLYHHWNGWLHVTMEHFADEFERVCDTGNNSVAFRLVKPLAPGRIPERLVGDMPIERKIALMDRAADRWTGEQANLLRSAKAHFLEMLADD